MLQIGLAISNSDGGLKAEELSILSQQINTAFELSEDETRRLDALRSLLIRQVPDVGSFRKAVKGVPSEKRAAVGKLALALVAADGVVTDDELKAVRYCFGSLGLDKAEIDTALRPLLAADDEPVTVVSGPVRSDASDGEAIPLQSELTAPESIRDTAAAVTADQHRAAVARPTPRSGTPVGGLKLNRAAIAAIMKDTQEVAAMLASAMQVGGVAEGTDEPPTPNKPRAEPDAAVMAAIAAPNVVTTSDPTLPERYAAFYQVLLAKGDWSLKEAEVAAREHGHMLAGAIETLNDWAFEKYGGQLFVEDGERLVVELALLN
jgi:tellurite resistance protein